MFSGYEHCKLQPLEKVTESRKLQHLRLLKTILLHDFHHFQPCSVSSKIYDNFPSPGINVHHVLQVLISLDGFHGVYHLSPTATVCFKAVHALPCPSFRSLQRVSLFFHPCASFWMCLDHEQQFLHMHHVS